MGGLKGKPKMFHHQELRPQILGTRFPLRATHFGVTLFLTHTHMVEGQPFVGEFKGKTKFGLFPSPAFGANSSSS